MFNEGIQMKCFSPSFKSRNKSTSFFCLDMGTGNFFVFFHFSNFGLQPCIMCAQYIGGCSVHQGDIMSNRGMFSTSGDVQYIGGYHEYIGGYHEYIGGCSVHWRDTMSTSGGYYEYIGGCSVHRWES